jgi:hypothetical protein
MLPAGIRVYVACGVTDMRNYAEFTIMQSPRRRCVRRRGGEASFTPHNPRIC